MESEQVKRAHRYLGGTSLGIQFGQPRSRNNISGFVELQGLMSKEKHPDFDCGESEEDNELTPRKGNCVKDTCENNDEKQEQLTTTQGTRSSPPSQSTCSYQTVVVIELCGDDSGQENEKNPHEELNDCERDTNSCFVEALLERDNNLRKQETIEIARRTSIESQDNALELQSRDSKSCSSDTDSVCWDIRYLFETADRSSTGTSCELELYGEESLQGFQDITEDLDGDVCRICHCGNESEVLISPCLCMGTVQYVHHTCLMDWLQRCVKTKCELCLYHLTVSRRTKPLKKWRPPGQKPTPIIWLLTFIIALTLNVASIAKDGSQQCISNPCIIFYVVGALGAMLGFVFFYHWLIKSIQYVKKWMALNEEWTLIGPLNLRKLGNANLAVSNKSLENPARIRNTELQMV